MTDELIEAADAIGIPCIVIDEDFDWSTLPKFSDLFSQSTGDSNDQPRRAVYNQMTGKEYT